MTGLSTGLAAGLSVGPVAGLAAVLVGTAAWLLLPPARAVACASGPAPRATRPRSLLARLRTADTEPPAVRVARAASEVAALLRAGAVPAAAWAPQLLDGPDAAGPRAGRAPDAVAAALDAAARAAGAGHDPSAALRRHRTSAAAGAALGSLALAWRTSEVTGAPAASVLDGLAAALRDEAAALDARDASLAGPRATARLLLVLPLLGLAASAALGADPVGVLLGTVPGRWCAALGTAFAAAGAGWTSALVRAAERAR